MSKRVRSVAGLVAMLLSIGGCGTGLQPSGEVTTANPSWPNWFKVVWTVESGASGKNRITGYVHNGYGESATEVQLLTQALDKTGAVIHQRINFAGHVPPLSRSYFEVRDLPAADQYRVTVWAFNFHQGNQNWP